MTLLMSSEMSDPDHVLTRWALQKTPFLRVPSTRGHVQDKQVNNHECTESQRASEGIPTDSHDIPVIVTLLVRARIHVFWRVPKLMILRSQNHEIDMIIPGIQILTCPISRSRGRDHEMTMVGSLDPRDSTPRNMGLMPILAKPRVWRPSKPWF